VKALIIGVGRVGSAVAARLREAGWEVVVVDENEEALGRLGANWPGEFHLGHGMDTSVLEQAGIQEADALVASTDGDNTNIVVAQVAKRRYEVPAVAARILDPARAEFYSGRGFDVVSPTSTAIAQLSERVLSAGKS
jgi:trk system potassium uptake protein TrkA